MVRSDAKGRESMETHLAWFSAVGDLECFLWARVISYSVALITQYQTHEFPLSYTCNAKSFICYNDKEDNVSGEDCQGWG